MCRVLCLFPKTSQERWEFRESGPVAQSEGMFLTQSTQHNCCS